MSREQDAKVAEVIFGVRFWKERRGIYELCVTDDHNGREPWMSARDWQSRKERYTRTTGAEAARISPKPQQQAKNAG